MRVEIIKKLKEIRNKILIFILVILALLVITKGTSFVAKVANDKPVTRSEELKDTYNESVFGSKEIPEKDKEKCVEIMEQFIQYCNDGKLQEAYDLLNPNYKANYMKTLDDFKFFTQAYFAKRRGFSYQNLTNLDGSYIYKVKLYNDLMTSTSNDYGLDNENTITIAINKQKNGMDISLDGYVTKREINKTIQNEYIKATIVSKEIKYDESIFTIEIENISDDLLVFSDANIKYILKNTKTKEQVTRSPKEGSKKSERNIIAPGNKQQFSYVYSNYVDTTYLEDDMLNIYKMDVYNIDDYLNVMNNVSGIEERVKRVLMNQYLTF